MPDECMPGVSCETKCLERGCLWTPAYEEEGVPWCFYPDNYRSYSMVSQSNTQWQVGSKEFI